MYVREPTEFSGLARLHTKLLLAWFKEAKAHHTCSVVHVLLSLEAWKIQEWGSCGFFLYGFKSTETKWCVTGLESPQDHERTLHRTVTWSLGCSEDAKMLKTPELCDICQRCCMWGWNQPKRKMYVPGSKGGGAEPSRPFKTKVPIPNMKLQNLVFALLGFSLA